MVKTKIPKPSKSHTTRDTPVMASGFSRKRKAFYASLFDVVNRQQRRQLKRLQNKG